MSGRAAGRRLARRGGVGARETGGHDGRCPVCQDVAVAGWNCPYCDVGDEDSPAPGPMPEAGRLALVERQRHRCPPALAGILAAPDEASAWPSVRTTRLPGGAR